MSQISSTTAWKIKEIMSLFIKKKKSSFQSYSDVSYLQRKGKKLKGNRKAIFSSISTPIERNAIKAQSFSTEEEVHKNEITASLFIFFL